jgi:polyhydroxyalkanoate synthesis regulator phasin
MAKLDDVRKTVGSMTPARAREMAKDLLEPGAAKGRIDRLTADLVDWSQRNGERVREMVRKEIADQLQRTGLASKKDLDALKKRVRALERARTPGRSAAKKPTAKTSAAKKTTSSATGEASGG